MKMKTQEEIKAIGFKDGAEMARESGSSEAGADGWDAMLINAVGQRKARALFGLAGDTNPSDDAEYSQALLWYCAGAQEGAEAELQN